MAKGCLKFWSPQGHWGLVSALAAKRGGVQVPVFEKDLLSSVRGEGKHRGPIQLVSGALAVLETIFLFARNFDLDDKRTWVREHKDNRHLFRFIFTVEFYEHPSFSHPPLSRGEKRIQIAEWITNFNDFMRERCHQQSFKFSNGSRGYDKGKGLNRNKKTITDQEQSLSNLTPYTIISGVNSTQLLLYIVLHMLVTDILTQNIDCTTKTINRSSIHLKYIDQNKNPRD